jgi:hypothetical protein
MLACEARMNRTCKPDPQDSIQELGGEAELVQERSSRTDAV